MGKFRPYWRKERAIRIAILSDIHDNIWNLEKALRQVREAEAQALIFFGDFCAPFSLAMLIEGFPGETHVVPGNNDGDVLLLSGLAASVGRVSLHQPWGKATLGGMEFAFAHRPEVAQGLACSGKYDVVLFGHTHRYEEAWREGKLLLNPGEVMGRFGEAGWVLYEAAARRARRLLL